MSSGARPSLAQRGAHREIVAGGLGLMVLCLWLLGPRLALAAEDTGFAAAAARGPIYAALATFASGFLVSLTPCVYPMVAVTVSVFGARQVKSRVEGALLSLAFVAGIVVMFVGLGVAAGLTGGVFGSVLSDTWVVVGISTVFVVMALSMFGAFELDLPEGLKNRLATVGGTGYLGAFILGLICGPISAPCTGPFLTGILAWIAQSQSALLGALAMATFALGLGLPFFLVGAFAVQLPKSGGWMLHVKSLLGIILCVVALYFLGTAFPALPALAEPDARFVAFYLTLLVLGLALGAVHLSFEGSALRTRLQKGAGVVFTVVGAFLLMTVALTPSGTLSWERDAQGMAGSALLLEPARARARAEKKPLLIDFTAAWCVACKEIDKETFADPAVASEAGRFIAVKVDATDDEAPMVAETMKRFGVVGLPTVLLIDSQSQEARRFTAFVDPTEFLQALRSVD